MVGLPGQQSEVSEYHDCIDLIESHVKQFSTEELEAMNAENKQAGVTCLKPDEFKNSEHVCFSGGLEIIHNAKYCSRGNY
jgi:hypothetical protein